MVSSAVTRVDSFIGEEAEFGGLLEPTVVVLLAGVALAMQDVAALLALGSEGSAIVSAFLVSMAINVVEPFVLWMLFVVAFYLLMQLFGGSGRIGQMLTLAGWGFASLVPAGIVWAIGRYVALQGETVPELTRIEQMGIVPKVDTYQNVVGRVLAEGDPVLVLSVVVGCLFVLSGSYVWKAGLEHATTLDGRQAAIVATLPPVVYVINILLSIV